MSKRKSFSLNKDLQEGLIQTMTAVQNYAGELHYEIIPLEQLELDPDNPRDLLINISDLICGPKSDDIDYAKKIEEIDSLKSLAETIAKQGLINPVTVFKHGIKYRVVAGERRTLASIMAGKKDIKANVLNDKPSEYRRRILQWIENIERADLRLWERLQNIRMILSAYKKESMDQNIISASVIKNILGCSLPHAMNYHATLNGSPELLSAISSDKIRNLEKAALISKITNEESHRKALSAAINGASLIKLKQIAKEGVNEQLEIKKQLMQAKMSAGRGRKTVKVSLGATTSPLVVKKLMDSILEKDQYRHYRAKFDKISWESFSHVSLAFKELITILEKIEG